MNFLYSSGVVVAKSVGQIFATSKKSKDFFSGRKLIWDELKKIPKTKKVIWMHCASLGEYEQGFPILDSLKNQKKDFFYLVTFFSPSGYNIKKKNSIADLVTYLPWDTKCDVKRFVSIVNPYTVLFIKYEFWPNLILELSNKKIPIYSISSVFRSNQIFFKKWGGYYLSLLKEFKHFFVQNLSSKKNLEKHGINNVTVSGDTRFDNVSKEKKPLDFMKDFIGDKKCIVAGSTWSDDEKILINSIVETSKKWCWLIAPHEIKEDKITDLQKKLNNCHRYTTFNKKIKSNIMILDTVGILSRCYQYAEIAYVGGAMGRSGLHNILEPASEGIPIIIGKNYSKFNEAIELIKMEGIISVANNDQLKFEIQKLIDEPRIRKKMGEINKKYIKSKKGATKIILNNLYKLISI